MAGNGVYGIFSSIFLYQKIGTIQRKFIYVVIEFIHALSFYLLYGDEAAHGGLTPFLSEATSSVKKEPKFP